VKALRKFLKYCLPFGAVEIMRNRRQLRELGREGTLADFWRSECLTTNTASSWWDATKSFCLNGRATMSDGLYVNETLVPAFAKRNFV
jgi:hypothetical protein